MQAEASVIDFEFRVVLLLATVVPYGVLLKLFGYAIPFSTSVVVIVIAFGLIVSILWEAFRRHRGYREENSRL